MKSLFAPIHFIIACYLLITDPYWIGNEFYIFGYIYLWIAIILVGFIAFENLALPLLTNPTFKETVSAFLEKNYYTRFIVSRFYCFISAVLFGLFLLFIFMEGSVKALRRSSEYDTFILLTLLLTGIFIVVLYPSREKQDNEDSQKDKNED